MEMLQRLKSWSEQFQKWFSDTEKPKVVDWILVGSISILAFFLFLYFDYMTVLQRAMNLLDSIFSGDFFGFYQNSIENTPAGLWGANYEVLTYFVSAIWNLPLYIIHLFIPIDLTVYTSNLWVLFYAKLMMPAFLLASLYILYRICLQLNLPVNQAKWAVLLMAGSAITIFPTLIVSQVDILSSFFSMLGIRSYLKHDRKMFCIWFAISIPMKLFFALVFFPLLLLEEKKIIKLLRDGLAGISLLLLCKLLFWNDAAYRISTKAFSEFTISRLTNINFQFGDRPAPLFVLCFLAICVFCYMKHINSEDQFVHTALWIPVAVLGPLFIFTQYPFPYWLIIMSPYMVMLFAINVHYLKQNLLIDTVCWFLYFLQEMMIIGQLFRFNDLLLPNMLRIDYTIQAYPSIYDFLISSKIYNIVWLFYAGYVICMLSLIIINFPHKDVSNFEKDSFQIQRSIVWCRSTVIVPFMILTILCYFPIKPLEIYDTSTISFTVADINLLSDGVSMQQPMRFTKPNRLDKLDLMFGINQNFLGLDTASIVVEIQEADTGSILFQSREPINMIYNQQMYSIKLKGLEVEADKEYLLNIYGRDGRGQEIYLAVTEQQMLADPLLVNGKEYHQSPVMKLTAKASRSDYENNSTAIDTQDSLNAEVLNISYEASDGRASITALVKNTGDSLWSESDGVRLYFKKNDSEIGRAFIAQSHKVEPGEEYTFIFNLSEFPEPEDFYSLQMIKDGVAWFGEEEICYWSGSGVLQ